MRGCSIQVQVFAISYCVRFVMVYRYLLMLPQLSESRREARAVEGERSVEWVKH